MFENQHLGHIKYIKVIKGQRKYLIEDFKNLSGCYVFATKKSVEALMVEISSDHYDFESFENNNFIRFEDGFPIDDYYSFKVIKPDQIISIPYNFNTISSITPDALNSNFEALKETLKRVQLSYNNQIVKIDSDEATVMLPNLDDDEVWVRKGNTYRGFNIGSLEANVQEMLDEIKRIRLEILKEMEDNKNAYISEIDGKFNTEVEQGKQEINSTKDEYLANIVNTGDTKIQEINNTYNEKNSLLIQTGDSKNQLLIDTFNEKNQALINTGNTKNQELIATFEEKNEMLKNMGDGKKEEFEQLTQEQLVRIEAKGNEEVQLVTDVGNDEVARVKKQGDIEVQRVIDAGVEGKVNRNGDTMTGTLVIDTNDDVPALKTMDKVATKGVAGTWSSSGRSNTAFHVGNGHGLPLVVASGITTFTKGFQIETQTENIGYIARSSWGHYRTGTGSWGATALYFEGDSETQNQQLWSFSHDTGNFDSKSISVQQNLKVSGGINANVINASGIINANNKVNVKGTMQIGDSANGSTGNTEVTNIAKDFLEVVSDKPQQSHSGSGIVLHNRQKSTMCIANTSYDSNRSNLDIKTETERYNAIRTYGFRNFSMNASGAGQDVGYEIHVPGIVAYKMMVGSNNALQFCQTNGDGVSARTLFESNTGDTIVHNKLNASNKFFADSQIDTVPGGYAEWFGSEYSPLTSKIHRSGLYNAYSPGVDCVDYANGGFMIKYGLGLLRPNSDHNNWGQIQISGIVNRDQGTHKVWNFNLQSGDFSAGGNVIAYSDKKLKKDFEVIPNALDKIQSINGYTYTRKDTNQRQAGVIAQEIQKVLPEVVISTKDNNNEETLAVAYGNISALLIEGVKELKKENDELKARLAKLEKLLGVV